MRDYRDFCSPPPTTSRLSASENYVVSSSTTNPISSFNSSKLEIIKAGNPSLLVTHPMIGRLLIIASVSAFENYCRGILAGCLSICPIAQGKASDKNISLGGAIWHGVEGNFNRSAFENKSFTDSKELRTTFREYIGFDLADGIFADILAEFDRVMQLRHAVAHADGRLPGKNALKLEIKRSTGDLLVTVNQAKVQECLLIMSTLAATINRELFALMGRRWATDWRRRFDWEPAAEAGMLTALIKLFLDAAYQNTIPKRMRWSKTEISDYLKSLYGVT